MKIYNDVSLTNDIIAPIAYLERQTNKVNTIDSDSSTGQYPSAKAVYDALQGIDTDLMAEVTYSQLVSLRNNSQLKPGMQYRITDYTTTTVQADTQSAGNVFDVIVVADDIDKLNENARVIQHDGDAYFANSKLESWQLKYCIDNDTTKFAWADSSNGKGVIYWMKDEFNNECPYDFKNIKFIVGAKEIPGTVAGVYYYTFSVATGTGDSNITDHSLKEKYCYGNVIREYISNSKLRLNSNVFRNTSASSSCYSNTFDYNCYSNTFGYNCSSNTFGVNCHSNTFDYGCYSNTFGDNCSLNTFGNNSQFNTFGDFSGYNTFGVVCSWNTLGKWCGSITFGVTDSLVDCCRYNIFDNGCKYINLTTNQTTSPGLCLQNIHVCQGIIGTYSTPKTITVPVVGQDYQIEYKANNSQTILI